MAASGRDGTWDSALSAGGFAAIRSVGFESAGQVLATSLFGDVAAGLPGHVLAALDGDGTAARLVYHGWVSDAAALSRRPGAGIRRGSSAWSS